MLGVRSDPSMNPQPHQGSFRPCGYYIPPYNPYSQPSLPPFPPPLYDHPPAPVRPPIRPLVLPRPLYQSSNNKDDHSPAPVPPSFLQPPLYQASNYNHSPAPVRLPVLPPPVYQPSNYKDDHSPAPVLPPLFRQARPFPPHDSRLFWSIVNQINYYFSDKNLITDLYLRLHMDDNGWVPITLIADFRKIKFLTDDIEYISFAMKSSSFVEVQGNQIRSKNTWRRWVLPRSEYLDQSFFENIGLQGLSICEQG